jgi:mannose-1-phosphate guanylyltransferase/mannose-6-phosphate isomerase
MTGDESVSAAEIIPVILAGGSGTRLWPLSRKAMPKQFLALVGSESTFQQTLRRVAGVALFGRPIVVTNADFRFFARRQAEAIGIAVDIVLEPVGRDSAPAIATAAALVAERSDKAVMLALAADHVVADALAFQADCLLAHPAAGRGAIVTFGIRPDHADAGYGYIEKGAPAGERLFQVARFREKPDSASAARFVAAGFLWNSGNFMFRADTMLAALREHAPAVLAAAQAAVAGRHSDLGFIRLDAAAFAAAPTISIDHAVMEKTSSAAVVEAGFPWSDVGTWDAVRLASALDSHGNAAIGHVALRDARNAYVRSDGPLTAVIGLDGVVVVTTDDAVLVMAADAAHEIKALVEDLERAGERAARQHRHSFRPWGWYQDVDRGERFRVKRIVVDPGEQLSLQLHHHRAEHWIVVHGTAEITIGDTVRAVHENESVYIPPGEKHRLANPGRIPLELIEVQTGSYLEEDDIVRLDDNYSRR